MRAAGYMVASVALAALSAALVVAALTVHISVDKTVVRPGETVTITVTTDPPTPNLLITIEVIDPRGNAWQIFPDRPTDAEGKVVVYWTVPAGAPAGTWTLRAYVSGQPGVTDTTTITVTTPPVVGGQVVGASGIELAAASLLSSLTASALHLALYVAALAALVAVWIARRK